jgi:hypothetical protein
MLQSLRHRLFGQAKPPQGSKQVIVFFICLWVGILVLTYVGMAVPRHIAFSKTRSLAHRFFFYKDRFRIKDLTTGRHVIISIYSTIVDNCKPCTVVKQIGCNEGEHLSVTDHGYYYCGDNYLGHAKTHSRKGTPVENFRYDGIVPQGKFFAIGSCPDSFDSRYIGFLDKADVKAIAIPLF